MKSGEPEPGSPRPPSGTFWLLMLLGLVFVIAALFSGVRQWLDRSIGLERALTLIVGFLLLYCAVMVAERHRLRAEMRDVLEQVLEGVYGKNYRQQRDAIDILVRALNSNDATARATAAAELKRLTGQDFGEQPDPWSRWWESNRRTFSSQPSSRPPRTK